MHTKDKLLKLCYASIFAALITLCTAYLSIPLPGGIGFVHPGDMLIYLAASLLPTPFAIGAAAVGGILADLLAAFPVYIPATLLSKAIAAAAFTNRHARILCRRNVMALGIAALSCVGVYFLYEWLLYGVAVAAAGMIFNLLQSTFAAILYVLVAFLLDKHPTLKQIIKK